MVGGHFGDLGDGDRGLMVNEGGRNWEIVNGMRRSALVRSMEGAGRWLPLGCSIYVASRNVIVSLGEQPFEIFVSLCV